MIEWNFFADDGSIQTIKGLGYYVPEMRTRLCSPQAYFYENKGGMLMIKGTNCEFHWKNGVKMTVPYHCHSRLPIAKAFLTEQLNKTTLEAHNSLLDEVNQNLTGTQKELLKWHYRLGHVAFAWLQWIARCGRFGLSPKLGKCDAPLCVACRFGKAHRRPTPRVSTPILSIKDGGESGKLAQEHLKPGQCISVDQYQSKAKGRLWTSRGKTEESSMYSGGTIFVDHASGLIHVEHQVSLGASETVMSKKLFERMAKDHGVMISGYHGDNGIFTAQEFEAHL